MTRIDELHPRSTNRWRLRRRRRRPAAHHGPPMSPFRADRPTTSDAGGVCPNPDPQLLHFLRRQHPLLPLAQEQDLLEEAGRERLLIVGALAEDVSVHLQT